MLESHSSFSMSHYIRKNNYLFKNFNVMVGFEYFIISLKIKYIKFIFIGFSNLFNIFVLYFIASYFIIENLNYVLMELWKNKLKINAR